MTFRRALLQGGVVVLAAASAFAQDSGQVIVRRAPSKRPVLGAGLSDIRTGPAATAAGFLQRRLVSSTKIDDVLAADFNRDGIPEVAYLNWDGKKKTNTLFVWAGDKSLKYKTRSSYLANQGWSKFIGAADFNGDGKLDLAVQGSGFTYFLIFPGLGNGRFGAQKILKVKDPWIWDYFTTAQIFDYDGDGKKDIVELYWYNKVIVLRNLGGFQFDVSVVDMGSGFNCAGLTAGDFSGDGKGDLFTLDTGTQQLRFYESKGDGTFAKKYAKGVSASGPYLFSSLLNADAKLDLIGSGKSSGEAWAMLGMGKGLTGPRIRLPGKGLLSGGIASGDFNGDKKQDLAGPGYAKNDASGEYEFGIWYYQGKGTGRFLNPVTLAPHLRFDASSGGHNVTAADFNKDGKQDILGASYFEYGSNEAYPDSQSLVFFLGGKSPAVLTVSNLTMDRLEFEGSDIVMKGRFSYAGSNHYLYYDPTSKEPTNNAFLTFQVETFGYPSYKATYSVSGAFLDKRTAPAGTIELDLKLPTTLTPSAPPTITVSNFYLYDYNLVRSNKLQ